MPAGTGFGLNEEPLDFAPRTNAAGKKMPLELRHADQMPGSAIHEVKPGHTSYVPHPNQLNEGVARKMRIEDAKMHWNYRGREMTN
ncbi:hypothetical protein SAMN05421820_101663 [Pedobacter steynii]|uniref:Uncharacterized protein n=1 Tax=Pedobacter steynii TaxID=430522 RepID=A0A1G9KSJ4_9SPHI|nr:hypothetical protein [Pedobacter steynii]NQX38633.1 hypothetical protein [Pedobacter steynii]SDL52596.1 hypothetical protein SAMN05421820_101663 [Pedobacter steynii]